jgi:hypothetical protein
MLVKTWGFAVLLLSLIDSVSAQTVRPVAPTVGALPVAAAPQRVATKSLPDVVNVPQFYVTGTALMLPLVVNVSAFDVVGNLLKLPVTVNVTAFDVTGAMLKLPVTVTVPALAVTGNYKP